MKRTLWFPLLVVGVAALVGWHAYTHRVREFRGVLCLYIVSIPEDPAGDAVLLSNGRTYELDVGRERRWRDLLPTLDGRKVIVRGTLRVWRGPFAEHHRIRVHDLRPAAGGP